MYKNFFFTLFISFVITGLLWPQNIEMKSVTVAGFINKGKANQANINIMMGKSLSTFLAKISKNITPFKDVEETALSNSFWSQKELKSSQAINIAQQFSTEQVITGDYLVNDSGIITINVYVYNVINGDLLFKRTYKGDAGPEIFDTIDKMILDVSGLLVGKTISLGYLQVSIKPKDVNYRLFINDSFVKVINNQNGYFDKFIAGQSIDISLKSEKSDDEAMRKIVEIKGGNTNELDFNPSGTLMIEAMEEGFDVYLNGVKKGKTDSSGEFVISGVESAKDNAIQLKKGDALLSETNIVIKEGATKAIIFKLSGAQPIENKQNDEIEVWSKYPNGIKYVAKKAGYINLNLTEGHIEIKQPIIGKLLS